MRSPPATLPPDDYGRRGVLAATFTCDSGRIRDIYKFGAIEDADWYWRDRESGTMGGPRDKMGDAIADAVREDSENR